MNKMAKSEFKIIREAPLTNNCPECFGQDLTLRFYQKHISSLFYRSITSEVKQELQCNTCHTLLYPVTWTEDIERSVEYYQKAVTPEPTRIRFKPIFWILVLVVILLVAAGIYLYMEGII
jgi:hypothetical protein